jgi:hypothetical protein
MTMKTSRTNTNARQMWMDLALIFALTVLFAAAVGAFDAAEAKADVRVRVKGRIHTPIGDVYVDSGTHRDRAPRVYRPVRVRQHRAPVVDTWALHKLTRRDFRIAWRLSYLSGIREGSLLRMREAGSNWNQIGRHFDLPRPMVQAAKSQKQFERLVAHRRGHHSDIRWTAHGGHGSGYGSCCR